MTMPAFAYTSGLEFEPVPASVWVVEHHGTSGVWRAHTTDRFYGTFSGRLRAVAHARRLRNEGYGVRVLFMGAVDADATAEANQD